MNLRESINGLQSEIKINKPINKKQLFDLLYNDHIHLLMTLGFYKTLQEFMNDEGITNKEHISEYLEDMYGYENDISEQIMEYVSSYFQHLSSIVSTNWGSSDEDLTFTDNNNFKTLIVGATNDGDPYIIRHNI